MAVIAAKYIGRVQKGEQTAAKRTFIVDVGTHEAQTVTVSKAGGAFGATGGSTCTQLTGTRYKLVVHVDDLDTLGQLGLLSTGATDNQLFVVDVVDFDPYTEGAKSDVAMRYAAGVP